MPRGQAGPQRGNAPHITMFGARRASKWHCTIMPCLRFGLQAMPFEDSSVRCHATERGLHSIEWSMLRRNLSPRAPTG
jgi:hypothetical protein